jgi:hypothetical protein
MKTVQQREVPDTRTVNRPLAMRLARELGLPIDADPVSEYELKADLRVASFARGTTRRSTAVDAPEVADRITAALRKSGRLRGIRPERTFDFRAGPAAGWYLKETMTATPVLVPVPDDLVVFGAPEKLTVWVADPLATREEVRFDGDVVGSFVYLVEELAETPTFRYHLSGISALRLLMEGVLEDREITAITGTRDVWGRDATEHPVEKLRRAGGTVLREHTIETVYKVAYMTNEQAWVHNGVETRVNDILGYPLYIAE